MWEKKGGWDGREKLWYLMPQDVVMSSNLNVYKKTRKISKNVSMAAILYANSETTLCSKGLLSR